MEDPGRDVASLACTDGSATPGSAGHAPIRQKGQTVDKYTACVANQTAHNMWLIIGVNVGREVVQDGRSILKQAGAKTER